MFTSFITLLLVFEINSYKLDEDALLTIPEFVRKYGYELEEHKVISEDGYVTTIFRIPGELGKPINGSNDKVVLLQPGFICGTEAFLILGPQKSLGFMLVNRGYDVWIPNPRGTKYSLEHLYLNSNSSDYWNFSFHEIGVYDISATIDYITEYTKQVKIQIYADSQGCNSVFILLSERVEYNEKIEIFVALAPPIIMGNTFISNKANLATNQLIFDMRKELGEFNLRPENNEPNKLNWFCSEESPLHSKCIQHYDAHNIDPSKIVVIYSHYPNGSSSKQTAHFIQLEQAKKFQYYDHGPDRNYEVYGQKYPPQYNLTNVKAPTALIYGTGDTIATPENVQTLSQLLPNVVSLSQVNDTTFTHNDFIFGREAYYLVYMPTLEMVEQYRNKL